FAHGSVQGDAGEVRADLRTEARHLLAQLVGRTRREPHLHVRHTLRPEAVDPVDDAVVAVHRELRELPARFPDIYTRVVADLGHPARTHLVALAEDVRDVVGQPVGRRCLRNPSVADAGNAPQRGLAGATDPDRRMRLLHRTGPLTDVGPLPTRTGVR